MRKWSREGPLSVCSNVQLQWAPGMHNLCEKESGPSRFTGLGMSLRQVFPIAMPGPLISLILYGLIGPLRLQGLPSVPFFRSFFRQCPENSFGLLCIKFYLKTAPFPFACTVIAEIFVHVKISWPSICELSYAINFCTARAVFTLVYVHGFRMLLTFVLSAKRTK